MNSNFSEAGQTRSIEASAVQDAAGLEALLVKLEAFTQQLEDEMGNAELNADFNPITFSGTVMRLKDAVSELEHKSLITPDQRVSVDQRIKNITHRIHTAYDGPEPDEILAAQSPYEVLGLKPKEYNSEFLRQRRDKIAVNLDDNNFYHRNKEDSRMTDKAIQRLTEAYKQLSREGKLKSGQESQKPNRLGRIFRNLLGG